MKTLRDIAALMSQRCTVISALAIVKLLFATFFLKKENRPFEAVHL